MTYVFSAASFHTDSASQLNVTENNRLRVETGKDGGGIRLDDAQCHTINWPEYDYLTAEAYHESIDVLVLLFTFYEEGNRSITVHYGLLPYLKTKICLPLQALNGEKLFLDRYPGIMQSVLRGDSSVDRTRISGFAISTIESVAERRFELSGLTLSRSLPDFEYEAAPYIDELGQLAGKNWTGKTRSAEALIYVLQKERNAAREDKQTDTCIGRYGGWKQLRFERTGYFRTENDGMRWWFVDPEGYALFSTGMDCVNPHDHMRVTGMEHLIPPLPAVDGPFRDAWSSHGYSFAVANLIHAFGEEWRQAWAELTEHRLKEWGINTVGNWSGADFISRSELPYVYPMFDFPTTKATIFRDFPDVFNPEYEQNAMAFAEQLLSFKDDRRLVGYFMRNEPHWAFVDGLDLTEEMLKHPFVFDCKKQFVAWVEDKYEVISRLNAAWETSYMNFEQLLDSRKVAITESSARKEDFAAFNRVMIRRYVEVPARYCKEADPHHLNLGMRYAWVANDDLLEGCELFDVFSINCYQFQPDRQLIERISKRLNIPVMIGEFHFGAADAGMLAYGIRAVATQEDRGLAYRFFVEQAASIPELIGVHYFQLNDQPVLGRFDGENYQIGAVDVCLQPYRPFTEAMRQAHDRMYEIRIGETEPFGECPKEIPKTGF